MSGPVIWQSLKQLWGIVVLEYRYQGKLPDMDSYFPANRYSLPFRGTWTAVNGGITEAVSHSWALPSQRYAYDFLILDEKGSSCTGAETQPASFYCYGAEILAPADGVVAQVHTGEPDSRITKLRDVCCAGRDIRGNYIMLNHGQNEFSLLAHLRPGSIRVRPGQRVSRGDVLAACGNSGNTSEPHLHFQVQQGENFYSSPGLPIAFTGIGAKPAPNYSVFDSRDIGESAALPYITRGQAVWNNM